MEKSIHEAKNKGSSELLIVHTPVLLNETLEYLGPIKADDDILLIDSTLGEGGHSNAFLQRFAKVKVIGLDADKSIQEKAKKRLSCYGDRIQFFNGWFNDFYANYPGDVQKPDRILFDLGISVYHYESSKRGFSFRTDESLDMRLDSGDFSDSPYFKGVYSGMSAQDLVNTLKEHELADIIFQYAEERYSRRIARAIVEKRKMSEIQTARDLADCIYSAVPSDYRHGNIHPATKTFQAIRIAVNGELERVEAVLKDAFRVLKVGGRMGVITFHSLEDRIVKKYFQYLGKKCTCPPQQPICICEGKPKAQVLTRKPVGPTQQEIKENSPSRSAKLRVIEKL